MTTPIILLVLAFVLNCATAMWLGTRLTLRWVSQAKNAADSFMRQLLSNHVRVYITMVIAATTSFAATCAATTIAWWN